MGIRRSTLCEWQNRFPEISDTLKKGKAPVDIEVENALLKSAMGFVKTVRKPIKIKTRRQLAGKGTIEEEHVEFVDEEIYIPPNPTAQIFWLKNRRPDKWKDRQEVNNNVHVEGASEALKEAFERMKRGLDDE